MQIVAYILCVIIILRVQVKYWSDIATNANLNTSDRYFNARRYFIFCVLLVISPLGSRLPYMTSWYRNVDIGVRLWTVRLVAAAARAVSWLGINTVYFTCSRAVVGIYSMSNKVSDLIIFHIDIGCLALWMGAFLVSLISS